MGSLSRGCFALVGGIRLHVVPGSRWSYIGERKPE